MQLPETPPPPLAPLWDRVLRARALPPDLDVELLYIAIRDRLTHPEWEVRLHALRVLADLLPLSGNALAFPFDQVVDNLGHSSPNVRKAALDALKVFCTHCEDPECAAQAIMDKCSHQNIRPHSANIEMKLNVVTGLILSIPSLIGILKRRNHALDIFPIFQTLGEKLFDPVHADVAQRSLIKLRRVCGQRDYMMCLSKLDRRVHEKFRILCETYDEDSLDVYYAPRKNIFRDNNNQQSFKLNHVSNKTVPTPLRISAESSSDDSFARMSFYNNNFAKVIIETEIKFDSDTAITMTVLEENETESELNTVSEEDYDSSDMNMLRYSDGDSEDTDVVVKRVRFGGEVVKIRTPDSENTTTDDDHKNNRAITETDNVEVISTRTIDTKTNDNRESLENSQKKQTKRSGIPLPVIQNTNTNKNSSNYNKSKLKSKSLSELYDYFKTKNDVDGKTKENSGFALTLSEIHSPEKVPSPVGTHREVEVLHNLQRSPVVSPRRQQTQVFLEQNGFILNLLSSSHADEDLFSPKPLTPLQPHYDWEDLNILPQYVSDQLHNTANWIAAVKAADQLHSALLDPENVRRVEPAAKSLVQHMWALSDAVSAAKAPAEGAVCALVRAASNDCARHLLPVLVARMAREPLPSALPHAMLQRLALHHLVDLIFDPSMIGVTGDSDRVQSAQLRATLCLARAAGPAAVLSAVRRRLAGTTRADIFCRKLRERLSRPVENIKPSYIARTSQLPVPVRRRARSTPPPVGPPPPRRLRPLPDSAPLPGVIQPGREIFLKPLSPITFGEREPSSVVALPRSEGILKSKSSSSIDSGKTIAAEIVEEVTPSRSAPPTPSRSPSIRVEDYSENSNVSPVKSKHDSRSASVKSVTGSRIESRNSIESRSLEPNAVNRPDSPNSVHSAEASPTSNRSRTPGLPSEPVEVSTLTRERDVRGALAECILPPRHEDWEAIVTGLTEIERLAVDEAARAPASTWRAVTRGATAHVKSLRSRVARAACRTVGALFEHRGRVLEPELEETAGALLERCADVNRFLRADAAGALCSVACGGSMARAGVALVRRGAGHRAGPVRAAAAAALVRLVRRGTAARILSLSPEPRTMLLRAAGELLADASAEARLHARQLCLILSEDVRFRPLLKEAMPLSRYRAVEKLIDKLQIP
ncbi:uncharacterized protein LOC105841718 [Bombyx mori]|uniref:TOG domain-containing protein n=1 Tax=Bombyx mori TaxID=7091 RepID=A0A8R2HQ71_BOMMO|nr:uncharacterized protein LOC105841718 [Bombyx mori]